MHEEEFHVELRKFRHDKSIVGSGIFRCGISHSVVTMVERVKNTEVEPQIGNGFFDKKSKKKVHKEIWNFMPKNVPIESFFIDESAINQPDFRRVVDCFMCEYGTKEEITARRENVP